MIDRQMLEAILSRRFPGATLPQIATAANAIMGLNDDWLEVAHPNLVSLEEGWKNGAEFRVFKRVDTQTARESDAARPNQ